MMRLPGCALLLAASCAIADDISPWTGTVDAAGLAREEMNLWAESEEFDKALARAGKVRNDPALNAYLQGIMDKLYPEFNGKLRVRALDAPHLNAFAMPNGSIYINTGLLARLQNEAQRRLAHAPLPRAQTRSARYCGSVSSPSARSRLVKFSSASN